MSRPSLQPKHTRKTEDRRESVMNSGYRIEVDGEIYQAMLGDITPPIARELRKHTGAGFMGLMGELQESADIDSISAAMWVARRCAGEDVGFDSVTVSYDAVFSDSFKVSEPSQEVVDESDPEG